jgi:hypothetical protein
MQTVTTGRRGAYPAQAEAPLCPGILREAAAVPSRDRSLRKTDITHPLSKMT